MIPIILNGITREKYKFHVLECEKYKFHVLDVSAAPYKFHVGISYLPRYYTSLPHHGLMAIITVYPQYNSSNNTD